MPRGIRRQLTSRQRILGDLGGKLLPAALDEQGGAGFGLFGDASGGGLVPRRWCHHGSRQMESAGLWELGTTKLLQARSWGEGLPGRRSRFRAAAARRVGRLMVGLGDVNDGLRVPTCRIRGLRLEGSISASVHPVASTPDSLGSLIELCGGGCQLTGAVSRRREAGAGCSHTKKRDGSLLNPLALDADGLGGDGHGGCRGDVAPVSVEGLRTRETKLNMRWRIEVDFPLSLWWGRSLQCALCNKPRTNNTRPILLLQLTLGWQKSERAEDLFTTTLKGRVRVVL